MVEYELCVRVGTLTTLPLLEVSLLAHIGIHIMYTMSNIHNV